jgi:hypothetical protein
MEKSAIVAVQGFCLCCDIFQVLVKDENIKVVLERKRVLARERVEGCLVGAYGVSGLSCSEN